MLRHAFLKNTDAWLDRRQNFAGGIHLKKNPWQINESTKTDLTALVDTLTGLVTSNIWRIRRFTHPGCFAKTQGPVDQFGRSNLSQPWR